MSDTQAQITAQMAATVSAVVADPSVKADESAGVAIIQALTPVILAITHSTNGEPFYQSRVFWGSSVAVFGVVLNYFHVDFPAALQGQVTDIIMAAVPLGGSLYALYGRFRAKKPLGS